MLQIDAATTRRHLPFPALIDALRAMFVAGCEVPSRGTHQVSGADDNGGGTILLMPAWRAGARLGIKTVTIFPGNSERGLPGLHSIYLLFDARTGVPLAQLDGNEITSRRTAAAAALAASYLARTDARRLLILGTGRVAALLAVAMRVVRPIDEVVVWNHRPASAHALVVQLRAAGVHASATDDLEHAVQHADIVSCATLSTAALVRGDWLRPGTHLDLIGSFTPQMRETDAACFARSRVFVDTDEALAKSGDVLDAIAAGGFSPGDLQGTLAELCTGTRTGRADATERTLFKAVGSALEDLAAAELVWDAVQRASLPAALSSAGPQPDRTAP
ncbi:MAG: ornithine cyclodeaminase family protein [Caldimonas sp.]